MMEAIIYLFWLCGSWFCMDLVQLLTEILLELGCHSHLWQLLLFAGMGSEQTGFQQLWLPGSRERWCMGLKLLLACRILVDQGSNLYPLHQQADSLPVQGSPETHKLKHSKVKQQMNSILISLFFAHDMIKLKMVVTFW